MNLTGFYPVIGTHRIAESQAFYTEQLGFETTFAADWYVSLKHSEQPHFELALLQPDHPTVPEGFRTAAAGMLLNFEVADVDAQYRRLVVEGGHRPVLDIRSEDFGQRHFIITDPNGILIDVITMIPPQGEFAEQYT